MKWLFCLILTSCTITVQPLTKKHYAHIHSKHKPPVRHVPVGMPPDARLWDVANVIKKKN